MFRLIINLIILNSITVQSCPSSSSLNKPLLELEPFCPEYEYKEHEERTDILSKLPDTRRIGLVSLTGTHQSMTYSSTDLKLRTQELSLTEQLHYGVRVFDIQVRINLNLFDIFYCGIFLNFTLIDLMYEFDEFLKHNPNELVMIMINYDYTNREQLDDNLLQTSCIVLNDHRHNYIAGGRFISDWSFQDTINKLRGKILLMTTDTVFEKCAKFMHSQCLISNDRMMISNGTKLFDDIEIKWARYLNIIKNESVDNYSCYIHDLSVNDKYLTASILAKYGGYYDTYNNKCMEPMNYKIDKHCTGTHLKNMTIMLVDYATQEIIDHFHEVNYSY